MRKAFEIIKAIGGHYLLLELAVLAPFFGLAFNPGSIGDLMRIAGAVFIFNWIIGNYRLKQITTGHIYLLIIFFTILIISYFTQGDMGHHRSLRYYQAFPWLILAIHCIYVRRREVTARLPQIVFSASILLALFVQFVVYQFIDWEKPWGIYGIKHHLGYFASLTIPVLWYFLVNTKGWMRKLIYLGLFIDIYLLFESGSRIAWLAFFCGILGTGLIFFKTKHVFTGIGVFLIIACLAAALSGIFAIEQNIFEFLKNWRADERVALWTDTFRLLSDNSISDWIFGHGIGTFRKYYSILYKSNLAVSTDIFHLFPHNVAFQLIFENGLIGFSLVFFGLAIMVISLWRGFPELKTKQEQNLLIATFALIWINVIYCGLTQNFYSKFSMYPLSMICGVALVLLEKSAQIRPVQSWKSSIR